MMRLAVFCVAALALVAGLSAYAQDVESIEFPKLNKLNIPEVEIDSLDNGMRLYLLEDKSLPLFNVNIRINCGSYLEPAELTGLADMCATVMRTGGTENYSGDEIDEILENIGGTVETSMDITDAGAYVNVLSDYTDLGLEILAEVLRTPRFDEDKIDLARVQERTSISRRNDDPSGIALREYRKQIYGAESPYARTTEYATIEAITRDDLVAFHRQWYRPGNIQVAVWGDFDKKALKAKLNELFGDWQPGTADVPPPPEVDYEWRSQVYYVPKEDAKQSYIRMGHIGGLVTDPDYADRHVMNSILGLGFGSRLTDEVRTRLGLAYTAVGRYISNFAYPGYFFSLASTDGKNTVKAARAMMKQIASMQTEPPTDNEMERGKTGYLNSFVFNFDSKREVVGRIMRYDFYGLPHDFLQQEKERVEQVTKDDVVAAARRNLHPDSMIVLVVGNADNFDLPLDSLGLGPAEVVDISIPPPPTTEAELVVNDETKAKGSGLLAGGIEAMGGQAAFEAVATLHLVGNMNMVMPSGASMALPIEQWQRFPEESRSVMNAMGREIIELHVGDGAWRSDFQTGEMVALTAEEIAQSKSEKARGTIRVFKAYGDPYYTPVYAGEGEAEDRTVEWVALVDQDGKEYARFGFDPETGMLYAKRYQGETMRGAGTLLEVYSDIQDVEQIKMPMQTVTYFNGEKLYDFVVSQYEVNVELPADVFATP